MIKVSRHLFFKKPGSKTLSYEESAPAPEHKCEDHDVCGCTRAVSERPEGEPESVKQSLRFDGEQDFPPYFWSFELTSPWLTLRWEKDEKTGKVKADPHAYLTFGRNSLHVEYVEPYKITADIDDFSDHAFFADMYLGNDVDTSTMMNGHSPSRIVDLSKIKKDALWLHHCAWGNEAMAFMEGAETVLWKGLFEWNDQIQRIIRPFKTDFLTPVEELRSKLERPELIEYVDAIRDMGCQTLRCFRKTDAFRISNTIKEQAQALDKKARETEH